RQYSGRHPLTPEGGLKNATMPFFVACEKKDCDVFFRVLNLSIRVAKASARDSTRKSGDPDFLVGPLHDIWSRLLSKPLQRRQITVADLALIGSPDGDLVLERADHRLRKIGVIHLRQI